MNYDRAIKTRTENLEQILKLLNTHSVEYYTYTNMRVLMDEHRQEISLLTKNWETVPNRVQTAIRLLAYEVIDCDIDPDTLPYEVMDY